MQTKLTVSHPTDPCERHADAVAARVVRGAAAPAAVGRTASSVLHRAAAPSPSSRLPAAVSALVGSPGGGRPLDPALRARIEPHVGIDLGHVRVRQDAAAAAGARDLHARAFTSGATIYLAAESSASDVGLMAHEATHVAQQDASVAARSTVMRDVTDLLPDISVEDLIPDWILDAVRSAVRVTPGYLLLSYVTGSDPLTGEPVQVGPEDLVETLLTFGPFGAAVGAALQAVGVLTDVVGIIQSRLAAHNLTLGRVLGDLSRAWDQMSVGLGVAGNVAILEQVVAAILRDVRSFVESLVDSVLALVRDAAVALAESLLASAEFGPIWNLTRKVLHYDPLRGVEVPATTAEILADFLRLIGQEQRLAQMEERGTLQTTADWLDTQLATFAGLVVDLRLLFSDAWAAIGPATLPELPTVLGELAGRAVALAGRVGEFAATVIGMVLELVKDALLGWLSDTAKGMPGFPLLTVILAQDPFTGEPVERSAQNLIMGFFTLLPGGQATYDQLSESGVIPAAAERIESEMVRLGISLEMVTGLFRGIWDTLSLDDLLDPLGAFARILTLFGEPLSRLVMFVGVVVEVVVTLILKLMNFPSELLGSILSHTLQAIDDITRDPVGFLVRMVEALKLGFVGFFDHIGGYLIDGLVAWLFRGLGQLGITLPTDLSLGSILGLIAAVLGLTAEHLWDKLGQHLGPERVQQIRTALDTLTGVWAFIQEVQRDGLAAIWRYAADQLSTLWSTLLGMATEWIMKTIIVNATVKLLSFLDPSGIMAIINGCVAFFNLVVSAIEYLRDLLEVLDRYVSTLAAVAAGNVVPGAQMLERGLASIVPIAIGFLAKQLGLGNVPDKIVELIGHVRAVVDKAIDWLITQAIRLGQAALNALGLGTEKKAAGAAPGDVDRPVTVAHEAHVIRAHREGNDLQILMSSDRFAIIDQQLDVIRKHFVDDFLKNQPDEAKTLDSHLNGMKKEKGDLRSQYNAEQDLDKREKIVTDGLARFHDQFTFLDEYLETFIGPWATVRLGDIVEYPDPDPERGRTLATVTKIMDHGPLGLGIQARPAYENPRGHRVPADQVPWWATGRRHDPGAFVLPYSRYGADPKEWIRVTGDLPLMPGGKDNPFLVAWPKPAWNNYPPLFVGPPSSTYVSQSSLAARHAAKDPTVTKFGPGGGTLGAADIGIKDPYRLKLHDRVGPLSVRTTPGGGKLLRVLDPYGFNSTRDGLQGDHVQDIQMGGEDELANLWILDTATNTRAGTALANAPARFRDGKSPGIVQDFKRFTGLKFYFEIDSMK
ncbi:protein of unknown function [Cryptosporangium aurantiacum]|uniref:eCIS core domain-containing protein n=1 Tax=Cryptosporangium aurantiacum TaxID=134849 RepID=A0A1M7P9J8_9ACTN|nr:protein of unknown function [Cryptosporangium aurantiacum]